MFFFHMFCTFCLITNVCGQSVVKFQRESAWDNYTCCESSYLFYENTRVRNWLDCLHLCQNDTVCVGAVYSPRDLSCTGCTYVVRQGCVIPANMMTQFYIKREVTMHGHPCDISTICGPNLYCSLNGICTCNPGYSYDRTVDSCHSGCLVYGDTFEEHPEKKIGANNLQLLRVDFSTCRDNCMANVLCLTFDYTNSTAKCTIQRATALTAADQFKNSDANHFHRNCA